MHHLFNSLGTRLTGRKDFTAQYSRYRETVLWILAELYRFDSKSTAKSVLFNVLGGLLKTASMAFLLYYVGLMEQDNSIILLDYSLEPRSGPVFYFALSVTLMLLVCGAFITYAGSHVINKLSVDFSVHCSQGVVMSSGKRPAGNPHPSLASYPPRVAGSVTGIIIMSRAVKRVLLATNPLATLFYSLIMLFYLNAMLSLVILAIALSTLLLQYMVNYHSAQNEKRFTSVRSTAMQKLKILFANHALTPRLYPCAVEQLESRYQRSKIGEFLEYYYLRIMAPTKSALVSDLLLAGLSFMVAIILGRGALNGTISWAHFITYLVFARICLMSFRGVLVSITGFARYYARARRTYEYLRPVTGDRPETNAIYNIVARGKDSIGDRKQFRMKRGEPLLVISSVPLSRYNLYAFTDMIAGKPRSRSDTLAAATECVSNGLKSRPGGSLDELLQLPAEAGRKLSGEYLQLLGLPVDIESNALLVREDWQQLPGQTRARILLQGVRRQGPALVLVDHAVLHASGPDYASGWLTGLADLRVGVVSRDSEALQDYSGRFVALLARDGTVSLATTDWCRDNSATIKAWLANHAGEIDGDDDDLVDDE